MSYATSKLEPALLDEVARLAVKLPPLPPVLRYFDDFENEWRSVRALVDQTEIELMIDGTVQVIRLGTMGPANQVYKHILVDWFSRFDPHSIAIQNAAISSYVAKVGLGSFVSLVTASPFEARAHWNAVVVPNATVLIATEN